ncbi:hypothetical protein ACFO6X_15775, partial [Giesbergeria sinuosa]
IGTGAGSFFPLCCWLWVAAVWAWVLTWRSSGQLSAAAYLSSLALAHHNAYFKAIKIQVLLSMVFKNRFSF